jgi:hypothetical protein
VDDILAVHVGESLEDLVKERFGKLDLEWGSKTEQRGFYIANRIVRSVEEVPFDQSQDVDFAILEDIAQRAGPAA